MNTWSRLLFIQSGKQFVEPLCIYKWTPCRRDSIDPSDCVRQTLLLQQVLASRRLLRVCFADQSGPLPVSIEPKLPLIPIQPNFCLRFPDSAGRGSILPPSSCRHKSAMLATRLSKSLKLALLSTDRPRTQWIEWHAKCSQSVLSNSSLCFYQHLRPISAGFEVDFDLQPS
jgi:hypothetical protein